MTRRDVGIQLNGEPRTVPDGLTVSGLLRVLDITHQRVAVEVNLEIVPKGAFDTYLLRENDAVEIVNFVGGGQAGYEPG